MWTYHYVPLLLLGVSFVNSAPVQDYDTGFENEDNLEDADTYTGYFTYIGNPDLVNNNHLSTLDSSEEELQTLTFIQDPCPVGQMFQSELSICIDYPHGRLLPPKKFKYEEVPASGIMLSDDPAMTSAANQRAQSSVIKLTMVDFGVNHGCKSNENYISELDICLTEGSSEVRQKSLSSEEEIMLSDSPVMVSTDQEKVPISKANQKAPSSVIKLTMVNFGVNHGCKPSQIYISELDICYGEED